MSDDTNDDNEKPKPAASSGNYSVGYGKPPRQHQFAVGDGRKRGRRPKGGKNAKTLLRQEHARSVHLRNKDGSVRKVSALAALIQKDVADAYDKERVRARQIAMAMQLDAEDEAKASNQRNTDIGSDDAAILARYLPAALAEPSDAEAPPRSAEESESDEP